MRPHVCWFIVVDLSSLPITSADEVMCSTWSASSACKWDFVEVVDEISLFFIIRRARHR